MKNDAEKISLWCLMAIVAAAFQLNWVFGQEKPPDIRRLVELNRDFFVRVEIQLTEGTAEHIGDRSREYGETSYSDYIQCKKKLVRPGLVFSRDGFIVLDQLADVMPNQYGSVVVVLPQGKRVPARYYGRLADYPGDLVKIEGETLLPPPLEGPPASGQNFYLLYLENRENHLYFQIMSGGAEMPLCPLSGDDILPGSMPLRESPSLAVTAEGGPLSILLGPYYSDGGKTAWIAGPDPKIVTAEDLMTLNQDMTKSLKGSVYPVAVHFRHEMPKEYGRADDEDREIIEIDAVACSIDGQGTLLVPRDVSRGLARRITEIYVEQDGIKHPATFEGVFRDFGAFLIHCEALRGAGGQMDFPGIPLRGELFYAVSVSAEAGHINGRAMPVRYLTKKWGYKDQEVLEIFPLLQAYRDDPSREDIFFVNRDSSVIGFYGCIKIDDEDRIKSKSSREASWKLRDQDRRLFGFASLRQCLAQPRAHFDPEARPQQAREIALENLWLGVDLQPASPALLEILSALDVTKGGSIGLLVSYVYKNSPAARIGLKPLDILVSIATESSTGEIVLEPEALGMYDYAPGLANYCIGDDFKLDLCFGRFFPSRRTAFENLLNEFGTERKMVLKYFRDGQLQKAELAMERAPLDFDTAEKMKDEELGLAVKDVTYEVKECLNLGENYTGAIVLEAENGKPASIAELLPYEIIETINGVRIEGARHFLEVVEEARTAKAREITLLVNRLNKSRIVILPLAQAMGAK